MEGAANIFNRRSRTADKGWSSSLEVGRGANNPSPKKKRIILIFTRKASEMDRYSGTKMVLQDIECGGMDWIELAQNLDGWHALVNVVMKLQVP